MKTATELRIEYAYFSWDYDFPSPIETALENDFLANRHLYDENALKRVAMLLLIAPDATPSCVLVAVRNGCGEVYEANKVPI